MGFSCDWEVAGSVQFFFSLRCERVQLIQGDRRYCKGHK